MRISPPYLEALDAEYLPSISRVWMRNISPLSRGSGCGTQTPSALRFALEQTRTRLHVAACCALCNHTPLQSRGAPRPQARYRTHTVPEPWCLQAGGCAACRSARTSATPPPHASRRGARAPPLPRRRCRVGGAHVRGHVLRHVQDTSDRRCWRGGSKRRRRRRGARGAATTRHVRDMSATRPRYAPAGGVLRGWPSTEKNEEWRRNS